MFNADGTLFYLTHPGDNNYLYAVDRTSGQVTRIGAIPLMPDGNGIKVDGARWDPTNPRVLYGMSHTGTARNLWKVTFGASPNYLPAVSRTLLHDFAVEIPMLGGTTYSRVSITPNSRYFGVVGGTTGGQDKFDTVVIWDSQANSSVVFPVLERIAGITGLHSMALDKSGEYALLDRYVWHWPSDTLSTQLTLGSPDCFGGHQVYGVGEVSTPGVCGGTDLWLTRSLASPHSYSTLLAYPRKSGKVNWMEDSHSSSMLDPIATGLGGRSFVESRIVPNYAIGTFVVESGSVYKVVNYLSANVNLFPPEVVRYQGHPLTQVANIPTAPGQWYYHTASDTLYLWLPDSADPQTTRYTGHLQIVDWRPMMEEIVQNIQEPTGTWTSRRLAHHRSHYTGWDSYPRANVDPTGSVVLFESNWDGTLVNGDGSARSDVFLLFIQKVDRVNGGGRS
jgi:hypothetical protein